ncbi:nucleotidyl transferase AbiEii/AbiGii toxin family protein [bacterium]|nr:nucleotidyl transferase AbiEii/AbiGii toxin family protein [bacterium]
MKDMDLIQSIKQRLLNLARSNGEDYNHVLVLYGIERFLYRLSLSKYANLFILKGALLLYCLKGNTHRMTSDIDLLCSRKFNSEELESIIKEICNVNGQSDGLVFQTETLKISAIKKEDDYGGIRVKLKAKLGNSIISTQLDIGFGDYVFPKPHECKYPTLLNLSAPQIIAYSLETSIAEKFHAMVKNGMFNSRLKDFYDIWIMSSNYDFQGNLLQTAIAGTFKRRRTQLPSNTPVALSDEFAQDQNKNKQWKGFCNRIGVEKNLLLEDIIGEISIFLMPIIKAIKDNCDINKKWSHDKNKWIEE